MTGVQTCALPICKTSFKENGVTIYDQISFLGLHFKNTEFYAYLVSLSYIVVALLAPVLSGIADYSGSKKKFLQVFCLIGGISSSLLYFFQPLKTSVGIPVQLGITILPLFFASIGYWGSIVYYNAYLPEIADPEHHDRISARGFAMGYFGGALLLILILVLTPRVLSYNAGFILVGIWWIGFAQLTFRRLPNTQRKHKKERHIWKMGFLEFGKVLQDIRKRTALKRYLASYFMFNMAVQTVMIMATAFANKEVHGIKTEDLIISILLIQFLGIAGSFLFSRQIGRAHV